MIYITFKEQLSKQLSNIGKSNKEEAKQFKGVKLAKRIDEGEQLLKGEFISQIAM